MSHKDAAFIYKGFQNWKDGTVSLPRHESSDCHKESVQSMIVHPRTTQDIGEQLSEIHSRDKKDNRQLLLKILQNIRFLARQNMDDSRVQQCMATAKSK